MHAIYKSNFYLRFISLPYLGSLLLHGLPGTPGYPLISDAGLTG